MLKKISKAIGIDFGNFSCVTGTIVDGEFSIIKEDYSEDKLYPFVSFFDDEILLGIPGKSQKIRNR